MRITQIINETWSDMLPDEGLYEKINISSILATDIDLEEEKIRFRINESIDSGEDSRLK